jgi:hypothetical protein
MVLSQVLETVINYPISANSPSDAKRIARVRDRAESLAEQQSELATLRPEPGGAKFMNCWFLSLGMLLVILDGVTSNETFEKSLFNTRHVVMGSMDMYHQHAEMLKLRSQRE